MDRMPDHIVLSIFKASLIQDRLLSHQLVCNKWRNLAFYNLCKHMGPTLDVGLYETLSIVGIKQRHQDRAILSEQGEFLEKFLKFFLQLSEKDTFNCIRFSTSKRTVHFPEWTIDVKIFDFIQSHCPNIETLDLGNAEMKNEAMSKLLQFNKLKHLAIRRVDSDFAFVLDLLQLESLTISGKQASLSNIACNQLKKLIIDSPTPTSYLDLLQTLSISAPNLEKIIRRNNANRDPMPGDLLAELRSHPKLKSFSDHVFFLNDDNALNQLIDTKSGQFENLRINTEDCVRLSLLGQMEKLKTLSIDGRNLEPNELASIFSIPTLERVKIAWTFKDDRSLDTGSRADQKMMDIRCGGLKSIYLHLDFLSAYGRAWGKNVIVNVLQQCPRLKEIRNTDWLLATDYVELREVERFVDVIHKIDININSAMDLFSMLHIINVQDEQCFTADPFCWHHVTELSIFINEDYYVCDLSCINGSTLPNLRNLKISSDDDVFFERFCQLDTLNELSRIDGIIRFENSNGELDWLDQIGDHKKFVWLSTIQTTLTPSLFCDVFMRSRARMREDGYESPATVLYVTTAAARKYRLNDIDRNRWDEMAKILYTNRIMVHFIGA